LKLIPSLGWFDRGSFKPGSSLLVFEWLFIYGMISDKRFWFRFFGRGFSVDIYPQFNAWEKCFELRFPYWIFFVIPVKKYNATIVIKYLSKN